jgi:hypothetical protein
LIEILRILRFLRVPFLRKIIWFRLPPLPAFHFLEYESFLKRIWVGNIVDIFDLLREAPDVVGNKFSVYPFNELWVILREVVPKKVLEFCTNNVYIYLYLGGKFCYMF